MLASWHLRRESASFFGALFESQTGQIIRTASSDTSRKDYRVTLQHPAGMCECTRSLEVQTQTPPGPLEYAAALNLAKMIYVIFVICQSIVPILPTNVDSKNNLIVLFPELPAGLTMYPRTGVISGSPIVPLKKKVFTVTASNLRGTQSTKIYTDRTSYTVMLEHTVMSSPPILFFVVVITSSLTWGPQQSWLCVKKR